MPLHETAPGSKQMVFVNPKDGKFVIDIAGEEKRFEALEGTLDLIRTEFDPGNPQYKIQPYDAFIIHLSDEEKVYRIKMNLDRNFVFSIARALNDLNKGDKIMAKAVVGDDPTVTFCNLLKKSENGDWSRVTLEELPKDKPAKLARVKEIVENHPAFSPKVIKDSE